jgi:hypothetical protein
MIEHDDGGALRRETLPLLDLDAQQQTADRPRQPLQNAAGAAEIGSRRHGAKTPASSCSIA